jgi:serine/threonine protein kinase/TPR repeat protein
MLESSIFDHYEVLTRDDGSLFELGRGGMGITYKAFDTSLRMPVALKVINANYLKSEVARQRFVREARSAARLRNRHVASVFHLAMKGDTWFYAMEFIDGETLGALIKRHGPLRPALALAITAQVARALNEAAHHGLVHRDIKPDNLMLVEDDDELIAKVIDFGLAKASIASDADGAASLSMGGFVGTAHFASPEQWEEREIDTRSDIYSLGVTLWYMLTGRPPFLGSMPQVMRQHLSKPAPFERLEGSPIPVVDLLRKMLAKDPAERFQTPGELRKAIEAAMVQISDTAKALTLDAGDGPLEVDGATILPQETASFETNTTIADRYQVVESCGETNEGSLYRAFDIQRKSEVRLLVLHPEALGRDIAVSMIEREVEKLATVQHANLLGVFGFETVDRGSFLVFEWTEGFTLLELLKARRELHAEEALALLGQAAAGVDHALSLGLRGLDFGLHQMRIHFSQPIVKEKLLRAPLSTWPSFKLKLYALGATRDITSLNTRAGNPTFVADADLSTVAGDARTEYVQALAGVVYEVLGGTISPLILRRPGGPAARYTPLSTLSEEGNEALRRALDPARSFPSARAFCEALGKLDGLQVRRHEPTPADGGAANKLAVPPPAPPMARREKRRPSMFARVLTLGVFGGVVIAVYLNSFDDERDHSGPIQDEKASKRREPPARDKLAPKIPALVPSGPPLATPAAMSAGQDVIAPTTPPPGLTPQDLFKSAVNAAQELEGKGDWGKSLDAWLKVTRNYPEIPQGKENLERLLKQLRERSSPLKPEEFQDMRSRITEAARLGALSAMLLLGDNLRRQSPKEAFFWYSEAAAQGNAMAETVLGFMLSRGDGVDHPDLDKAFEHFKSAADKGNVAAKYALGECYLSGFGVAKDARQAVRYLREAAEAKDPRALNRIGDCYRHGEGVEKKNLEVAFNYFAKAKELGNLDATGNLGLLYLYGEGVAKNPKAAADLFLEGAKAGDSRCMLFYADCLEKGQGVSSNSLEATSWYRKAAEAGNEEAMEWLRKHKVSFSPGN